MDNGTKKIVLPQRKEVRKLKIIIIITLRLQIGALHHLLKCSSLLFAITRFSNGPHQAP